MKAFPSRLIWAILALAFSSMGAMYAQDDPQKPENAEKRAETAGVAWLRLLDKTDLDAAWGKTSSQLRESVTQEQFKTQMRRMRDGLGPIMTRKLDSANYRTTVTGAQEGQYVVLVFNSRFKDRGRASEVLTLSYDNGDWKPVGYFVR